MNKNLITLGVISAIVLMLFSIKIMLEMVGHVGVMVKDIDSMSEEINNSQ